jgi:hypothetical protein
MPSFQDCTISEITEKQECPCSEDPCKDDSNTCSPFCGQAGCGIVIKEDNLNNNYSVHLPEQKHNFVYSKNNKTKKTSPLIWHPPKC